MVDLHVYAWLKGIKTMYYFRAESPNKASLGNKINPSPKIEVPLDDYSCIGCEG